MPTSCTAISAYDARAHPAAHFSRRRFMKAATRSLLAIAMASLFTAGAANAQYTNNEVKLGVLSDMSSLYTDLAGAGSVVATKMAIEDSGIEKRGIKVTVVEADHQNKADVG